MAPAADGMQLLLQRWVIIDVEPARTCPFFFLENIYLYFILYLCVCECVCVWGVGGWKYIPTCCTKEFSVMSAAFSHEIIGRDVRCVAKKKKRKKKKRPAVSRFFSVFLLFHSSNTGSIKSLNEYHFFFYLTTKWHSEVEVEQIIFAIITWDSVMKFSIDGWIMFFFILWRIDRSENKNIECTAHVSDQLKKKQQQSQRNQRRYNNQTQSNAIKIDYQPIGFIDYQTRLNDASGCSQSILPSADAPVSKRIDAGICNSWYCDQVSKSLLAYRFPLSRSTCYDPCSEISVSNSHSTISFNDGLCVNAKRNYGIESLLDGKKNIVEIVIISGKHTWPLLPMLNKNPVIRFLMIFFNDQKPFLTPQPTEL